jgi:hypothetical protein
MIHVSIAADEKYIELIPSAPLHLLAIRREKPFTGFSVNRRVVDRDCLRGRFLRLGWSHKVPSFYLNL